MNDLFIGQFEPKEEVKFKLGINPKEKVSAEVGSKNVNPLPEDIDVRLALTLGPTAADGCTARWSIVIAELPGKFDLTDVSPADGIPDTLKFTVNGNEVPPAAIVWKDGIVGSQVQELIGPLVGTGSVLNLHWRLLNVVPGEKVETEPYIQYACTQVGEFIYPFDLQIVPVGKTEPFPLDNVAAAVSTVIVEP